MLDLLYALVLAAVVGYTVFRERPALALTSLMLMSFILFYGIGHFVFYADAEAVPLVQERVTVSLVMTWIALLAGIEAARVLWPRLAARQQRLFEQWPTLPVRNEHPASDALLLMAGLAAALVIWGTFVALGKPSQISSFISIESALGKQDFRLEEAGGGGYLYQTLIASAGPFLSILLLAKGKAGAGRMFVFTGAVLAAAVFAGKLGTFHKVPWLIFIVQLLVAHRMLLSRRLQFSGILLMSLVVVLGTLAAAKIALPELDAVGLLQWVGYRFFEVNNEVVYQTFYVYPDYLPHTWGMNIGLVHRIFSDGPLISAHTNVANFFGAFGATFDPFYIGDAWVDFGYGGVIGVSVVVGFIVKMLDLHIARLGKSPLAIALTAGSVYGVFQLQVTSAFTAFLSGGLLSIPLAVGSFSAIVRRLKRSLEALRIPASHSSRGVEQGGT